MSAVIKFESVSKKYSLGSGESFREMLARSAKAIFRSSSSSHHQNDILSLENVSFEVARGETLGLIGTNGAGKTTTLKLLSKVTRPTTGRIYVQGRVSALIELGAGFHPDLTGRENIYLNGAILGLSQQAITKKFDSIVAFAELERFIDTPVKRYSSGMYARLGFAVAAHSDPDVLLVDEVLAVGDVNFQKKCHDFIHRFVSSGKTAVFVSHNMFVFEHLCRHVIWLDKGKIMMWDEPAQVLHAYLNAMDQRALEAGQITLESRNETLRLKNVRFVDSHGSECDKFVTGEDIIVEMHYYADEPIPRPHFCIGVSLQGGPPLFLASMLVDGQAPPYINGSGVLRCRLKATPLLPKVYDVWGEVWGADRAQTLVQWQRVGMFRIVDRKNGEPEPVLKGSIRHIWADAPVQVPYEWEY
jgi:lipopolysaccharide transport system ATP-binding protein